MIFHKAGLVALVLVFMMGFVKAAWAEEETLDSFSGAKQSDFIKERSYIGVIGTSADIDQYGDFIGTNYFTYPGATTISNGTTITTNPEVDLIPSITREFGWGVLVGHREGPWAAEVSFWRSDHTASFIYAGPVTTTNPASLQAINIDFKRYFFTEFPTQPFISLGISFPWLYVQNSSYLTNNATPPNIIRTSSETISGIGLNLGAGMEIYLDNGFSIFGGLYERWTEFDQINGAADIPGNDLYWDGNPSDRGSIAGNGLNLYVGGTVGVE
jgi:hypothetical protein